MKSASNRPVYDADHSPHILFRLLWLLRAPSQGWYLSRIQGSMQRRRQYCRSPQTPFPPWRFVLLKGGMISHCEHHNPLAGAALQQSPEGHAALRSKKGWCDRAGQCCWGGWRWYRQEVSHTGLSLPLSTDGFTDARKGSFEDGALESC